MQLAVGNSYLDRQGTLWRVVLHDPATKAGHPFLGHVAGKAHIRQWYASDGRWSNGGLTEIDLVERAK